jgi:peptidoglycan/LPS O-acetylase OafA/YrhL
MMPHNSLNVSGQGEIKGTPGHIDSLDLFRGVAILAVALFHSLQESFGFDQLGWNGVFRDFNASRSFLALLPMSLGWLGVAVFFVISGFCIHLSHARASNRSLKVFFLRRFFRIWPPYAVCLLVFAFAYPWHSNNIRAGSFPAQFLSHLFLVQNLGSKYFYGIDPSFWSIAVEMQLYLLYPILLVLARKQGWMTCVVVTGVVELAIRMTMVVHSLSGTASELPRFLTDSPFAYWFSWTIGAALGNAFISGTLKPYGTKPTCLLACAVVTEYLFLPSSFFVFPTAAALTVAIISISVAVPSPSLGTLAEGVWHRISSVGTVSYSMYLIHQPLLGLVPRFLKILIPGQKHPLLCFAACLASLYPIFVASGWIYRHFELPSIALGKRISQRV